MDESGGGGANGANGHARTRLSEADFASAVAGYARVRAGDAGGNVIPGVGATDLTERAPAPAAPAAAPVAALDLQAATVPEPPPPVAVPREASRRVRLRLDQVLVLARDNVSRGGMEWGGRHREVRELAGTIAATGRLLEPPCVRPLPAPLPRAPEDGGGFYTHRLVFGFKRVAALWLLGWEDCDFEERDLDDEAAFEACLAENIVRSDPTDYELALALAEAEGRYGLPLAELSRKTGIRVDRAESLLRIARRCPQALLEIWRASPTPRVRGDLDRVSQVVGRDERETHRKMLDEWARLRGDDGARPPRSKKTRPPRTCYADVLRVDLDRSGEWYDATSETWRPIPDEAREFAHALLRHMASPKTRKPLR